ncbi:MULTISPECIES: TetR/AcrR family transcriptional regulator [Flagellimonas]|uniref:TetR/AcrR family transcriptional regulator n=1 Tax=Flagellimonas hadalis TaxID=2597517 RepID=A0A5N5IYZ5_9FLAO|nr:TetR/AcrR family transcriptional regulator [Allomuricauda hadalis]KAB5490912.1 TetR/AcrR family transcriptional regulator [Allomuricauda hadalis]
MDKKSRIIDAGLRLIEERGLHRTPMAMIAERADVGMGTVYKYFKDKEDIINAIYVRIKQEEAAIVFVNQAAHKDVKLAFFDYYSRMIDYFVNNPVRFNFISQYAFSPIINETTQKEAMSNFYPFDEMYQMGLDQDLFKEVDAQHLTYFVFSAIAGWLKSAFELNIELTKNYREVLVQMAWDAAIKNR